MMAILFCVRHCNTWNSTPKPRRVFSVQHQVSAVRNIAKTFPDMINYLLIFTWLLAIIASTTASPTAGEKPTVDGEVSKFSLDGDHIPSRLVRYSTPGRRNDVIKCNATSVKAIKWIKGASIINATDEIKICPEKRATKGGGAAPCTENVKDTAGSENSKSKNRQLNLVFNFVRKEDFGPYTCITVPQDSTNDTVFGTTVHFQKFSIYRLFEKGHRSVTVVAGDPLSLYCNINGADESEITVKWYKDGEKLNPSEYKPISNLSFHNVEAEAKHRGYYKCSATFSSGKEFTYEFYVRVKDKLLPLWPFLGICLNVAALCIILGVYEKRKNKMELKESDSDGSPDQGIVQPVQNK